MLLVKQSNPCNNKGYIITEASGMRVFYLGNKITRGVISKKFVLRAFLHHWNAAASAVERHGLLNHPQKHFGFAKNLYVIGQGYSCYCSVFSASFWVPNVGKSLSKKIHFCSLQNLGWNLPRDCPQGVPPPLPLRLPTGSKLHSRKQGREFHQVLHSPERWLELGLWPGKSG